MTPNVRLDHCVVHVSDWPSSNAFYRDVLGAEPGGAGTGRSYRFGAQQLTEEEVWDVVEVASMYNFTNRMSLACGMIPNEEYHALARQP